MRDISRRGFLGGGLFTVAGAVALVKAERSDLLVPDRRIVSEVPADLKRAIVQGRAVGPWTASVRSVSIDCPVDDVSLVRMELYADRLMPDPRSFLFRETITIY